MDDAVIDKTDNRDCLVVLYKNEDGRKYVRERKEFYEKFERTNMNSF